MKTQITKKYHAVSNWTLEADTESENPFHSDDLDEVTKACQEELTEGDRTSAYYIVEVRRVIKAKREPANVVIEDI